MRRTFRRLVFATLLGMLFSRMLRRRGGYRSGGRFDPDGPGWGRRGEGRHHREHGAHHHHG